MTDTARRTGASAWHARIYWAGVVCAMLLTIGAMRYREAPTARCTAKPQRAETMSGDRATHDAAGETIPVARYPIRFDRPDDAPLALTVGRALPFYRLTLNGANLTPGVDLAADNVRDLAPHLHVLPAELLHARDNVAELVVPEVAALGPLGVEQVCVGPLADVQSAFRANWWRMVGIPRICLMLYIALAMLAIALWALNAQQAAYAWYLLCLVPLIERSLYLSTAARPGGPLLWIHLGNLSLIVLPYALYGFMRAHWRFPVPWLMPFLHATALLALLCIGMRGVQLPAALDAGLAALFVLLVTVSSVVVAAAILWRVRSMHRVERRAVTGVFAFGFIAALPEALDVLVPFAQRWMWTNPLSTIAVALGLGYLLIRRMAIGGYVLGAATDALAGDIDQAIAADPPPDKRVWAHFAAGISRRERSRLIRDIHDGFGARLVAVLAQARRELPHSPLQGEIRRALLDMRMMIDAMDDSLRSLATAMGRLRHRIEQSNPSAEVRCCWRMGGLDDVMIGDRARLVAVFRCLEELLSEALADGRCDALAVEVRADRSAICFAIEGDEGWDMATIRRAHRLIHRADGQIVQQAGPRVRCEFSVPSF